MLLKGCIIENITHNSKYIRPYLSQCSNIAACVNYLQFENYVNNFQCLAHLKIITIICSIIKNILNDLTRILFYVSKMRALHDSREVICKTSKYALVRRITRRLQGIGESRTGFYVKFNLKLTSLTCRMFLWIWPLCMWYYGTW